MFALNFGLVIFLVFITCTENSILSESKFAFAFPSDEHESAVLLRSVNFPKKDWTISFWFNQVSIRAMSTFATFVLDVENGEPMKRIFVGNRKDDDEWILGMGDQTWWKYSTYTNKWTHVVITWRQEDGTSGVFVNGTLQHVVDYNLQPDFPVEGNFVLALGAFPLNLQNSFEDFSSFSGILSSFNMWDRILCPEEVKMAFQSDFEGNIIAWSKENWTVAGNVERVDMPVKIGSACELTKEDLEISFKTKDSFFF